MAKKLSRYGRTSLAVGWVIHLASLTQLSYFLWRTTGDCSDVPELIVEDGPNFGKAFL